jgi:hypothetical protein
MSEVALGEGASVDVPVGVSVRVGSSVAVAVAVAVHDGVGDGRVVAVSVGRITGVEDGRTEGSVAVGRRPSVSKPGPVSHPGCTSRSGSSASVAQCTLTVSGLPSSCRLVYTSIVAPHDAAPVRNPISCPAAA